MTTASIATVERTVPFAEALRQAEASAEPFFEVRNVLITPEDASLILEKHRLMNERTVTAYTWRRYARSMEAGKFFGLLHTFKFGQPVYGKEGVEDGTLPLFDGQHRLLAISNTGLPQVVKVMFGVPQEAHPHIDTNRVRQRYIELSYRGYDAPRLLDKLAARAVMIDAGLRSFTGHFQPTIEEVEAVIAGGQLELAVEIAMRFRGQHLASDTAVGTAVYLILKESRTDSLGTRVTDFFEMLLTGTNLEVDGPIWVLRERLRNDFARRGRVANNTEVHTHFIVTAWNHWVAGSTMNLLRTPSPRQGLPVAA